MIEPLDGTALLSATLVWKLEKRQTNFFDFKMSCKVKDCGFISNCPEMMEYHLSSVHCQRRTAIKRKIGQDPPDIKTPPPSNSNSSSEPAPVVKLSVVPSPEVADSSPNDKVKI